MASASQRKSARWREPSSATVKANELDGQRHAEGIRSIAR